MSRLVQQHAHNNHHQRRKLATNSSENFVNLAWMIVKMKRKMRWYRTMVEAKTFVVKYLQIPYSQRTPAMNDKLLSFISRFSFFHKYDPVQRKFMLKCIRYKSQFTKHIFSQGEEGKDCYIIIKGAVQATHEDHRGLKTVSYLGFGEHFGEEVVDLAHTTRKATTRIWSPGEAQFLLIDGSDFREMLRVYTEENERKEQVRFLGEIPLFQGIDAAAMAQIIFRIQVEKKEAGQLLFTSGQTANCMYFVYKGRVLLQRQILLTRKRSIRPPYSAIMTVRKKENSIIPLPEKWGESPTRALRSAKEVIQWIDMGVFGPMDHFAEVPCLNKQCHVMRCVCLEPTVVLGFSRECIIENFPPGVMATMMDIAYKRVTWQNARIGVLLTCFARAGLEPSRGEHACMIPEIDEKQLPILRSMLHVNAEKSYWEMVYTPSDQELKTAENSFISALAKNDWREIERDMKTKILLATMNRLQKPRPSVLDRVRKKVHDQTSDNKPNPITPLTVDSTPKHSLLLDLSPSTFTLSPETADLSSRSASASLPSMMNDGESRTLANSVDPIVSQPFNYTTYHHHQQQQQRAVSAPANVNVNVTAAATKFLGPRPPTATQAAKAAKFLEDELKKSKVNARKPQPPQKPRPKTARVNVTRVQFTDDVVERPKTARERLH